MAVNTVAYPVKPCALGVGRHPSTAASTCLFFTAGHADCAPVEHFKEYGDYCGA